MLSSTDAFAFQVLMHSSSVFRRTAKGEEAVSLRSLPHGPWLALVMIDGKASLSDLVALHPRLPNTAESVALLLRDGYIEPVSRAADEHTIQGDAESPGAPGEQGGTTSGISTSATRSRWLRRVVLLLPVLFVALAWILVNRSLETFKVEIEGALTQVRGVSIGSASYAFEPRPALRLTNVALGSQSKVGEMVVLPAWSTLLGISGPIARVRVRSAVLAAPEVLGLLGDGSSLAAHEKLMAEQVVLEASTIDLAGFVLARVDGDLRYGSDRQLTAATFSLEEGKAQLAATRTEAGIAIEISARNWSSPTEPAVHFERLDASGRMEGTRFVLDRFEGIVHDGILRGDITLDIATGLVATGHFGGKNLDLQGILGRSRSGLSAGGRLDGEGSFRAQATSLKGLIENATLSADFRVKQGVVYQADFPAAAMGLSGGGSTQFEELTGRVQIASQSCLLQQIRLRSRLLSAAGNLDITPSQQIAGRFTVSLESQGARASTIRVGGNLTAPKLQIGG
jgi:hypothetical protein